MAKAEKSKMTTNARIYRELSNENLTAFDVSVTNVSKKSQDG